MAKPIDQYTWKDIPIGCVVTEAGNAHEYKTGDWKSQRPVVDKDKCIKCGVCWVFCPDSSVIVENEKMTGFRYSHCKGCGICATECPKKAITMKEEGA